MAAHKKYKTIMNHLADVGILVTIIRISAKDYQFLCNGTIKHYKQRQSINKRMVKLLKNNQDASISIFNS